MQYKIICSIIIVVLVYKETWSFEDDATSIAE